MVQYILGDKCYDSKKAAQRAVGEILKSCKPGAKVGDEVTRLLLVLLSQHPEKGCDAGLVTSFEVQRNATFGQTEFLYRTNDGRRVTFSYRYCFGVKGCAFLTRAYRSAVQSQVVDFREAERDRSGRWVCHKCGEMTDKPEVDHITEFQTLVKDFAASRPYTGKFRWDGANQCHFEDAQYADEWQRHHSRGATLQILCKPCHGSIVH